MTRDKREFIISGFTTKKRRQVMDVITRAIQVVLVVSTATLYGFAIRDELRGKGILLQRRSNDED